MCGTCGCGGEVTVGGKAQGPMARLLTGHHPHGAATRVIDVERALLAKNDAIAAGNRARFARQGIFAINLVSSPGSGKTSLVVKTIEAWNNRAPVAVVEGDQQTSRDAERVRATGVRVVQVNTGKGCHLDAQMVESAANELNLEDGSLLVIENVGNLVCPSNYDLGEAVKVVVASTTEGDDKPLKYPSMFRNASVLIINKTDLLPYLQSNVAVLRENALKINPSLTVFETSCTTGAGVDAWCAWLIENAGQKTAS